MLFFTLLLATVAAAAPCVPSYRFQWANTNDQTAGYMAVGLTGINSSGPFIDNGAAVYPSPSYLRYVNVEWQYTGQGGVMQLVGFNKCLDAGLTPANGTPLKVWDCYPGVMQQTWNYHDGVIQLAGTNLCVDVTDGNPSATALQLWQCYPGNGNQQWKQINE